MDFAAIDLLIQEATKHYVDDSLSNVHSKLQNVITAKHRADNGDNYSYGSYPYVHHVFGDKEKGTVVYQHNGKHKRASYKMDNGRYNVGQPEDVQLAYVPSQSSVKESATVKFTDRADEVVLFLESIISTKEGLALPSLAAKDANEVEEVSVFQEAGVDSKGNCLIKLISPGTGSMGHYSEEVLKKAAADKVFGKGTKMFMDHQTAQERAAKPEGDLKRLMATTREDAEYMESGPDGKGLYAKSQIYSDFVPFVKERKNDIGISIRAGVIPSGRTVNGVPEVKEMKYALSADFVTQAGRGGKVVEMYESFRSTNPRAGQQETEEMTNEEKQEIEKLRATVDRLQESNQRNEARFLVSEALTNSGLSVRGQERVSRQVMAALPVENGVLNVTKFQEAVKAAITDEVAYLQESGARISPFRVTGNGGNGGGTDNNKEEDETVLQEASKRFDSNLDSIMGREPKTAAK